MSSELRVPGQVTAGNSCVANTSVSLLSAGGL